MRTRTRHHGAVVWVMIAIGAIAGTARAADTPPVLEQTAEILGTFPQDHAHPQLKNFMQYGVGKKFKVNLKFLRRYLRFIDVNGDLIDGMQRPALSLINGEYYPFSEDSLYIEQQCRQDGNYVCLRVKDFPFAFGIANLKNPDPKDPPSPHAVLYIPGRFDDKLPAQLGDSFIVGVFHIPNTDEGCESMDSPVLKRHCQLLRRLSVIWKSGTYSEGYFAVEVHREYRAFFDYLLENVCVDSATKQFSIAGMGMANAPGTSIPKMNFEEFVKAFQVIFSHNEIAHGRLN